MFRMNTYFSSNYIHFLQKSKNIPLRQLAESLIWEFEGKYSDSSKSLLFTKYFLFILFTFLFKEK